MDRLFAAVLLICACLVGAAMFFLARHTEQRQQRQQQAREAAMQTGEQALRGYWVWERVLRGATDELVVSERSLQLRQGPGGWTGCPENILCTEHGIRTLAIGTRHDFHWTTNVRTSSDFQYHGRVQWLSPGLAAVHLEQHFSCAHPEVNFSYRQTRFLEFRRTGDRLFVAIEETGEHLPLPRTAPTTAQRWMVFRRVERAHFYDRLLVRYCQPTEAYDCSSSCRGWVVEY